MSDCSPSESALDFDPDAVDIGDTLKTEDTKHSIPVAVTDVDSENERVKVYTGTMANTVHRWVDMATFTVHVSNENVSSDEDRVQWLNEFLPQAYRFTEDDGRQELEHVITGDGEFDLQPVE